MENVRIAKRRKPKAETKAGKKSKTKTPTELTTGEKPAKTDKKVGKKSITKTPTISNTSEKPAKARGQKKNDSEPETNICEICGNIYAKRSLLNMHMRRHQAEKPFECE